MLVRLALLDWRRLAVAFHQNATALAIGEETRARCLGRTLFLSLPPFCLAPVAAKFSP
jgi:hypothetical protein